MKIYISADIEGVTGTTYWDETDRNKPVYDEFREQMTAEVAAACEGARNVGAAEILVKDAHDAANNLILSRLPQEARLIRGWAGEPFCMVQGLDETFHAALMIGYHAPAASDANPLAHTMNLGVTIKLNGVYASEFLLHAYAAALKNVPVVFISGDAGLCAHVQSFNPAIGVCAVKEGVGGSTISIHPARAVNAIREGVQQALSGDVARCLLPLPEHFHVEITYHRNHADAYRAAFYPGVKADGPHSVVFDTDDYFEVLRMMMFVV